MNKKPPGMMPALVARLPFKSLAGMLNHLRPNQRGIAALRRFGGIALLAVVLSGCGPAGEGEECGEFSHGEIIRCQEGLVCKFSEQQCIQPVGLEEECESGFFARDTCRAGLRCDLGWGIGVCRGDASPAVCGDDSECDGELVCNKGFEPPKCSGPLGVGAPCAKTSDCARGYGVQYVCNFGNGEGICREPGNVGEICAQTSDCASDNICVNINSCLRCAQCAQDDACEGGFSCDDDRSAPVCKSAEDLEPQNECESDTDCDDDSKFCLSGRCISTYCGS